MVGNITRCRDCQSYYTHWGIEKIAGGARMKDGVSYCKHRKKYRKLSKRDCYKRVNIDCPKRLENPVFRVFQKELDTYELISGQKPLITSYRFTRQPLLPVHSIDELSEYLLTEPVENSVLMSPGDIITLFDGLCLSAWLYIGGVRFDEIQTFSETSSGAIIVQTKNILI